MVVAPDGAVEPERGGIDLAEVRAARAAKVVVIEEQLVRARVRRNVTLEPTHLLTREALRAPQVRPIVVVGAVVEIRLHADHVQRTEVEREVLRVVRITCRRTLEPPPAEVAPPVPARGARR